jgi:hypothetical protein
MKVLWSAIPDFGESDHEKARVSSRDRSGARRDQLAQEEWSAGYTDLSDFDL